MSPSENQLHANLATAILRAIPWYTEFIDWTPGTGVTGDLFYHDYMSAFEAAAELLDRLHLVERVDEKGRAVSETLTPFRRLRISIDDVSAEHLAHPNRPPVEDILHAFLLVCDQRGIMPTSVDDTFFSVPAGYIPLMKSLAGAGFAAASGNTFRWTDKLGDIIARGYY